VKSKKEKQLKRDANSADADNATQVSCIKNPARIVKILVGFVMFFFLSTWGLPVYAETPGPVLVIPVHDNIDSGLSFFIQRMLRKAEQENFSTVILEINSNGGLVTASQEIKDALLRSKVTTAAYVRGRALSAAALIAISCHKIFMEPGCEMGAATPIMLMGSGVKAAEEKFVSAFRAEFESAAEARKRPKALAGAMVDKNHETIPGLVDRGQILTLTSETALKHGYCDQIVASLSSILRIMDLEKATVEHAKPTSAEWIARWLTDPNVSVIIFTIGFWCLIIEFFIAGFGFFGWLGVMCIGLFFGGHLFAYLAGLEALILFLIGLILIILEIFVVPGFGITGVSGIISLCFSIVMVFGGIYTALYAIAKIITYSLIFLTGVYFWGPKLKIFDRFILKDNMTSDRGFVAVEANIYNHLSGLEGIALSQCRPSGKVRIGDERYDVVSDGDFIDKGERVMVRKVSGNKIVVRKLAE
jgi:membrane-bound serine protease (ClpP class)